MASALPYGGVLAPSLVACLRFAAPVLCHDATPQDICTKAALGAIVVDAHRFAQEAVARDVRQADPRRLLAKIASYDDKLAQVAFADITWDSDGIAKQTLEIELEDLEDRANATLRRNFCVLLTASSAGGSSDHEQAALLWFPYSSEDASIGSRRYLLYVVPGRIKVVKSLAELTKRLFEEVGPLKSSSAMYRVWTLVGVPPNAKKSTTTGIVQGHESSRPAEVIYGSVSAWKSDCDTKKEETPEQGPDNSSLHPPHAIQPLAARAVQPTTVRVLERNSDPGSIFSFPRTTVQDSNTALKQVIDEVCTDQDNIQIRYSSQCIATGGDTTDNDFSGTTNQDSESPRDDMLKPRYLSDSPARPDVQTKGQRIGLCASHTQGYGDLTALVTSTPVYVSLDSKIKRHRDLVLKKNRREISEDPNSSVSSTLNQMNENPSVNRQQVNRVCAVSNRPPGESIFRFSSMHGDRHRQKYDLIVSSEMMSSPKSGDVSHAPKGSNAGMTCDKANYRLTELREVGSGLNDAEEATQFKKKKKSARDHYRNKLGARGWWEIEYQATKILRQEFQAYHHQQDYPTRTEIQTHHGLHRERRANANFPRDVSGQAHPEFDARTLESRAESKQGGLRIEGREDDVLAEVPARMIALFQLFDVNTNKGPVAPDDAKREAGDQSARSSRERTMDDCALHRTENEERYSLQHSSLMCCCPRETVRESTTARAPADFEDSVLKTERDCTRRGEEAVKPPSNPSTPTSTQSAHVAQDISYPSGFAEKAPELLNNRVCRAIKHGDSKASDDDMHDKKPGAEREIGRKEEPTQKTIGSREGPQLLSRSQSRFRGKHARDDYEHDDVLMATMESSNPGQVTDQQWVTASSSAVLHHVRNSEQDGRLSPTHDSAIPFNILGHLPIRRQANAITETAKTATGDDEEDPDRGQIESVERLPKQHHEKAHAVQKHTFTVDTQVVSHDVATQQARQMKLTELRQRKLQQLQRARDEAARKKKSQTGHHHVKQTVPEPVSFVLSSPKKETPALPTGSAAFGEAFPLTATTRAARKPSNRKLIQNALEFTLLAGGSLDKERQAALQAMAESPCDNFIVLLKSAKELKFRGLYEHHIERGRVVRLFAITSSSPPVLTDAIISQFFRYNSGKKEFSPIDARNFTVKTDACALVDELVFKKKTVQRLL